MTPHEFLDVLMQLAAQYHFRETSGFRSRASNRAIGGVPFSAHQYWLGRDIIFDPGEDTVAFREAAARLHLLVLDEGDHFHLQPLDWKAG